MKNIDIKEVQMKILETMEFVDLICKKHNITYYVMGGTAIGAVRHNGFIPWDDDLDIFMTPQSYLSFKNALLAEKSSEFILQEWKTDKTHLEYGKVRMNNTTFLESSFKDNLNMHHGIYIDIMILHKVPKNNKIAQLIHYYCSKYVTLIGLSKRNWTAKTWFHSLALNLLKFLPNEYLIEKSYKEIYKYKDLTENFYYSYFITKAKFHEGLFESEIFDTPTELIFEHTSLLAPTEIKKYLEIRYGDYMKLPNEEEIEYSLHADFIHLSKNYQDILREGN